MSAITSAHLPGSGFNRQELTQRSCVKSSYGTWPESQLTISGPQKKIVRGTLDRAFSGVNERRCIRTVSEGHTDITQGAMRISRGRTGAFHDERLD